MLFSRMRMPSRRERNLGLSVALGMKPATAKWLILRFLLFNYATAGSQSSYGSAVRCFSRLFVSMSLQQEWASIARDHLGFLASSRALNDTIQLLSCNLCLQHWHTRQTLTSAGVRDP